MRVGKNIFHHSFLVACVGFMFYFLSACSFGGSPDNSSGISSGSLLSSSLVSINSSSASLISSDLISVSDVSIASSASTGEKTRFDGALTKISDEIIYGPAVLYDDKIIYANGFTTKDKDKFYSDNTTTSYGIFYPDTGKLDKHIISNIFNTYYVTGTAVWFTYFSYAEPGPDTSIMFDPKTSQFKEIGNDTNPHFIETKNSRYTWTFQGSDVGIDQVDTSGKTINYHFSDLEEQNYINNLHVTNNCLWADWGGEGSPAGVSYLDFGTMKWQHFLGYAEEDTLKDRLDPIFNEFRGSVWADDNGDLYALCVYENGVNIVRYEYTKKCWQIFFVAKGNYDYFESDLTFFDDFVILRSGEKVEIINKSCKELEKTYMTEYKTYKILLDKNDSILYFMTDKGVYSQTITK